MKNISKTVANGIGKDGATYIAKSYMDIIYPSNEPPETAKEIVDKIKQKLKGYE